MQQRPVEKRMTRKRAAAPPAATQKLQTIFPETAGPSIQRKGPKPGRLGPRMLRKSGQDEEGSCALPFSLELAARLISLFRQLHAPVGDARAVLIGLGINGKTGLS